MVVQKFWFSANQKRWSEYVDANPIGGLPPSQGARYAVIDGCLVEFTESHMADESDDYAPAYDDAVFLGYGEYACSDWNVKMFIRKHPEIHIGKKEDWPELIVE